MSQENVEAVRQSVTLPAGRQRGLEEQIALRCPRLFLAFNEVWSRRSPHSPLRKAIVRRLVGLGIEAANRRDYAVAFAVLHPDYEGHPPPSMVSLGTFPAGIRNREERAHLEKRWRDEWGEFRYEPDELLDIKNRVLVLGRMVGSGAGSGVPFDQEWADLFTLSRGQVIREQVFLNHAEALEAAGLSE